MARGPFSGIEVVSVMVDSGIFEWDRTTGDHAMLRWEPPEDHDTDARTVPVPLHEELDRGTLGSIAEQAGARDFEAFCEWIDRHR